MERLTFEGNFCDIAMCAEVRGGSPCADGACSQRKTWERLKQYEDTGFSPEEVAKLKAENERLHRENFWLSGGVDEVNGFDAYTEEDVRLAYTDGYSCGMEQGMKKAVHHGRWKYYHKQNKAVCTECSFERDLDADFGKAVSCPNCGAKMDLERSNEQ